MKTDEDESQIPFKVCLKGVCEPVKTICPNCKKHTQTIIKYETTRSQWYLCMCFSLSGFWCMTPAPFLPKAMYNTIHYCEKCAMIIGTSKRG